MRKQRCTFTFYKLLSIILISVLSISTTISLIPNNVTLVEAKSVESNTIEEDWLIELDIIEDGPIIPLSLKTLNNNELVHNNFNTISLLKVEEINNDIVQQVNEPIKVEEINDKPVDNNEPKEEITEEKEQKEEPVIEEESKSKVVEEPVKEAASAQIAGSFTEHEIYEWAKIVYCEASGESQKCKEYIAQVILNRINSPKFPNTVHGVIFQSGQFSPTFDGSWGYKEPDKACYDAVYKVINSPTALTDALFFEACIGSSWHSMNLTEVAAIDNTRFYIY